MLKETSSGTDAGVAIQGVHTSKNGRITNEDLLVKLTTKHSHNGLHSAFEDLNNGVFTTVFHLFFLGDYDGRSKVAPVVNSGAKNIVNRKGNGLVASR